MKFFFNLISKLTPAILWLPSKALQWIFKWSCSALDRYLRTFSKSWIPFFVAIVEFVSLQLRLQLKLDELLAKLDWESLSQTCFDKAGTSGIAALFAVLIQQLHVFQVTSLVFVDFTLNVIQVLVGHHVEFAQLVSETYFLYLNHNSR